ncbi:oligosaccharide flippase family protein [Dactylosporangium roseum]|uniref:Oligosaccharide flippase family protein n=1 Tax=Dactylosporangium roseum TaxID=47989 RepID=A0ABY5Z6B5_9ACTN|nr:oligosaccharide flippase family protein [Dactylosporangium roseum]UWZ37126.1 oligosaccharide flippase family protein [Dactylosporangium roseum]
MTAIRHRAPVTGPSFVGNVGWAVFGNATYALSQWLVLVVVARLGTPSMVGEYALGLAVGAPVVLLANLSLRTVLVTDPHGEHPFRRYLWVRLAAMAAALAAIGAVVALFDLPPAVVLLVGAAKAFDGAGDIYLGLLQRHHDQRGVALAQLANGGLTIAFTAALLVGTSSVAWAAAGSAGASLIVWLLVSAPLAGRLHNRPDPAAHTRRRHTHRAAGGVPALLWTALPLGVASGVTSLTANVPRYALQHESGAADLGAFAAAGYLVLTGTVLCSAVAQTLLPRLTELRAADATARFRALVRQSLIGVGVAGAVAVWAAGQFGSTVLTTVYGPEYAGHGPTLTVLTLATALGAACFMLDAALSAVRRFAGQLAVNAGVLAVAVVAALVLVPRYGVAGAAWATAVAAAVHCGLKWEVLRRVR